MRSGEGAIDRGRQRQPLHRLGALVGAAALRSRRPGDARGGRGGAVARHDLRRADRGRGRPRRRDRRRGAVDRDGAPRLLRHRGGDERGAPGAGRDPPRPADQVLRQLPRPRRRAPRERRLGPDDARDPLHAGRPVGRRRRHDRAALQRRRRGRRSRGRVRGGAGGDPRRAGGRQHGRRSSRARLPRGAPAAVRRVRRAARLRRGDHRLPRRARRGAGALRRHARPHDPRQDRRRRPAGGGLRRPGRADGAARAGRRRLPGGHAVREPARDGGRNVGVAAPPRPGGLRGARAPRRAARGRPRTRSAPSSGSGRC